MLWAAGCVAGTGQLVQVQDTFSLEIVEIKIVVIFCTINASQIRLLKRFGRILIISDPLIGGVMFFGVRLPAQ